MITDTLDPRRPRTRASYMRRLRVHLRLMNSARCGRWSPFGVALTDDLDAVSCQTCLHAEAVEHQAAAAWQPGGKYYERFARRFWSHVQKTEGCWIWTLGRTGRGYGSVTFRGKFALAHRVAYELSRGKQVSPELSVCHRCDNPPCVRPDHLFLGTTSDNVQDAVLKGRRAIRARHGRAKLSESQVTEIRIGMEQRTMTIGSTARKFGVSEREIGRIVKRELWQ